MTLRTVARDTDSVRTISLIVRCCSKYARRISPILSTPIIPISPSRPIRAKGKDAATTSKGVGIGREKTPQGVNIASDFAHGLHVTGWKRAAALAAAGSDRG